MNRWILQPLVLWCVALPSAVGAQDLPEWWPFEDVEVPTHEQVVQNRKYDLLHEVAVLGGGLPVDPFSKAVTVSGGYTLHLSNTWAWEVGQFHYARKFGTGLRREVLARDGTARFAEIDWFVSSRLVLKPLYGKQAAFNVDVVHLEAFLMAGPAVVYEGEVTARPRPGLDAGFGLRLWLTPHVSLRVDVAELVYFARGDARFALHLHGGVAFNLRSDE